MEGFRLLKESHKQTVLAFVVELPKAEQQPQQPREVGGREVQTAYWPKPIADRRFDWSAMLRGYEPDEPIGYGATEADAVADLLWQVEG